MGAGRVGHRQPPHDRNAGADVDQAAARRLAGPPALLLIRLAQRRDVGRTATDQSEAVEMAAILGRDRRDELRLPPGNEVVDTVERAQAGKQRVHDPQVAADPCHLVRVDRPGIDGLSRQVAGIVGPGWVEAGRQCRDAAELPDLVLHRHRQALAVGTDRDAHRAGQAAVGQDEVAAVGGRGGQHQLACLVGRDQQRDTVLGEECRQRPAVFVIDPTQRRGRLALRLFRHGRMPISRESPLPDPSRGQPARDDPVLHSLRYSRGFLHLPAIAPYVRTVPSR